MKHRLTPKMEEVLRRLATSQTPYNRLPTNTAKALLRRGLVEAVPISQNQLSLGWMNVPHRGLKHLRPTKNGLRRVALMRLGHCHAKET